jgi:UDP:flavonoid glycosyltransferase YjiC (YdhE family)
VRATALGAGAMLARHHLTRARLEQALERCTNDPRIASRARELGERLAAEDGAETAADRIEGLAASERPAAA